MPTFISVEDEDKLEIVKDYTLRELRILIRFYEDGMFCDQNGQPYTRGSLMELIDKFGVGDVYHNQ